MLNRLLCLLLLSALAMFGQADANKGRIVGRVLDATGAVVPGANVVARNVNTGSSRSMQSDANGEYAAVLLDPGTYELRATSAGFAPATVTGVPVNVGTAVSIDLTLAVESTTTVVEVAAGLIDITMPSPSTIVNSNAITNLPINGRRFQDFALLTPTVQVEPSRSQLSFAGQRGINANVMVDGADYNQPFFGGIRGGERSNFVPTVPQSAIQEFQVVTTGYTAEYGRSTGGMLNTITKSGTNDWHGDAFYLNRDTSLGTTNPFGLVALPTQHQFGTSVGGPLKRDKLFVFGAVESQRSKSTRTVQFPNLNIADRTRGAEAYDFFKTLEGDFQTTNNALAATFRGDYAFTNGSRLTMRYNRSQARAANADGVGGATTPLTTRSLQANGSEDNDTHFGTVQLTSVFTPTVLNDLRFSGSYEDRPRDTNSMLPGVSTSIGDFGARSFRPTTQDDSRYQIQDSLSVIKGGHNVKLGVDYSRLHAAQSFGFNQFGFFSFFNSDPNFILDVLTPGGTTANRFDNSSVTYRLQIGNTLAALTAHQLAFFAQDSWRITPKLNLDFGLRWEGQFNPTPEGGNQQLTDWVRNGAFPIGRLDPLTIPDATRQIMPRFGFAYRPFDNNKTVIRGNAGIFYAATPMLSFSGPINNFRTVPGDLSIQLPNFGSTVYKDLLNAGVNLNNFALGSLPVLSVDTIIRAAGGRNAFTGSAPIAVANDYRNPRSFQAGFGVEHQLTNELTFGAQLNYVNAVHLQRNRDYNLPVPIIRATDRAQIPFFGLQNTQTRPVPQLTNITARDSSARSMYRAATFQMQYRKNKLQFNAFYTYSQNFSDDDSERDASGFSYVNSFNLRNEYGPSKIDSRNQFTANAVYSLPWGFEVSGIVRATSGLPIDPQVGSDVNQDFNNNDRPYSAPGVPFGRNSFRNRGFRNVDIRILKSFYFTETARMQLSAEFFNLFNFDNVVYGGLNASRYGPGIDSATGQTVAPLSTFMQLRTSDGAYDRNNTQIGNPFQAQLGIRFFF